MAVPAAFRLLGLDMSLNQELDVQDQSARGVKFNTGHVATREWSSGRARGGFPFNEVRFPLAGVLRKPAGAVVAVPSAAFVVSRAYALEEIIVGGGQVFEVTKPGTSGAVAPATFPQVEGESFSSGTAPNDVVFSNVGAVPTATGAVELLYDINDIGRDVIQTYTAEQGDLGGAYTERATYVHFTTLQVSSERTGNVETQANLMGRQLIENPLTPNASITELETIYGTPDTVMVYVDDRFEDFGKTVVRNSNVEFNLTNRFQQGWMHDRRVAGFIQHQERRAQLAITLKVGHGPDLRRFTRGLKRGQKKFIRFEIRGPQIVPGVRYMFQWDVCCQINDAFGRDDEDGMYLAELSLGAERDPRWGRTTRARLVAKSLTGPLAGTFGEVDNEGDGTATPKDVLPAEAYDELLRQAVRIEGAEAAGISEAEARALFHEDEAVSLFGEIEETSESPENGQEAPEGSDTPAPPAEAHADTQAPQTEGEHPGQAVLGETVVVNAQEVVVQAPPAGGGGA